MTDRSLKAVAQMLVTLAGCDENEQIDVLAAVARIFCDRESQWLDAADNIRLWQHARRVAKA